MVGKCMQSVGWVSENAPQPERKNLKKFQTTAWPKFSLSNKRRTAKKQHRIVERAVENSPGKTRNGRRKVTAALAFYDSLMNWLRAVSLIFALFFFCDGSGWKLMHDGRVCPLTVVPETIQIPRWMSFFLRVVARHCFKIYAQERPKKILCVLARIQDFGQSVPGPKFRELPPNICPRPILQDSEIECWIRRTWVWGPSAFVVVHTVHTVLFMKLLSLIKKGSHQVKWFWCRTASWIKLRHHKTQLHCSVFSSGRTPFRRSFHIDKKKGKDVKSCFCFWLC